MAENSRAATVDIICDLRGYSANVSDVGSMEQLWQSAAGQLIGKELAPAARHSVSLPAGDVTFWICNPRGVARAQADTVFRIVDVVRLPRLLYRCAVCNEYGPLRCVVCDETKRDTRLCSIHAHTIKDELKAYCPEHLPRCECQAGCAATALFRCRRCHRLFGDHYHRQHPNDTTVDYCHACYRALFERCVGPGCRNLGRAKCAFQTQAMSQPCGKPLCPEHSFQWKIWGPHNRGVTVCEQHKNLIPTTDAANLLFMMLHARPPYARRDRRASLPNPFRLRRILNRNRPAALSFSQIGQSLRSLEGPAAGWHKRVSENYRYFAKNYFDTAGNLGAQEAILLTQIRDFYSRAVGWSASQQIAGLEITDCYYKPGQPPRYRVRVLLSAASKGPFIGSGGATINRLRQELNLEVDL